MKELSKWHEKNEIHSWNKIGNDKETFLGEGRVGGEGVKHEQGLCKKPLLIQPGLWKHEIDVLYFRRKTSLSLIVTLCTIWHHLCNLRNLKIIHLQL